MTIYSFEAITAAEAMALRAGDVVNFASASATATSVLYFDDHLSITSGARTVDFSLALIQASQAGDLKFSDGSRLYIGDETGNRSGDLAESTNPLAQYGGNGADTLTGGVSENFIQGNAGDDWLSGGPETRNVIYGGKGSDHISVPQGRHSPGSFLQGNMGDDTIYGGDGTDSLLGGQDNDMIVGNGGMDYINGNLGNDDLSASRLGGWIYGESGDDTITGGAGGDNHLFGGDGHDQMFSSGPGVMDGGAGDDYLAGRGALHQVLLGGAGMDALRSEDNTPGREGNHLYGGDGGDWLVSRYGGDTLWGGAGNDIFWGGEGHALIYGEAGADTFALAGKDISSETLLQEVMDWTSEDRITFVPPGDYGQAIYFRPHEYAETTAASYAEALASANAFMQGGLINVACVQVGNRVFVFGDVTGEDNRAETAIILVGASLETISSGNLI